MAPRDETELPAMLATALAHDGPVAIRYPRGAGEGGMVPETAVPLPIGRGELVREGSDALVVAIGSRVMPAVAARPMPWPPPPARKWRSSTPASSSPCPASSCWNWAGRFPLWLTAEENVLEGGFGGAVLECLSDAGVLRTLTVRRLGLPRRLHRARPSTRPAGDLWHRRRRHRPGPAGAAGGVGGAESGGVGGYASGGRGDAVPRTPKKGFHPVVSVTVTGICTKVIIAPFRGSGGDDPPQRGPGRAPR